MLPQNLTADEIDRLEAGPELDALVAEHVMGIPAEIIEATKPYRNPPEYSSKIAAAWQVVEKLQSDGYSFMEFLWDGEGWSLEMGQGGHDVACDSYHRRLPIAISRAALKAVMK